MTGARVRTTILSARKTASSTLCVTNSGGAIRIESREGEGTRVEIELPAEAPAPTEVR